MVIGITGASGFLGGHLIRAANAKGHKVIGFSRAPSKPITGCQAVRGFDENPDVSGLDALVHLAGESVVGLWTEAKKQRILQSREQGTHNVVRAISLAKEPPKVFVSSSAIGYYGNTGDAQADEHSPAGRGFLADVAKVWETEAMGAQTLGLRVVLLRTSVVLGKEGGALKPLIPLFKAGLGGRLGSGKQWFSWIHVQDWAAMVLFAIENNAVTGPLNACAPEPVINRDFTTSLAKAVHRPAFFWTPAFVLRTILGEFSSELLESKRVNPGKALDLGFRFEHPDLASTLKDLV